MKLIYTLLIIFGFCSDIHSQTIDIHSITTSRQTGGDQGYTLDGVHMASSSRQKLLNSSNYGANGTYAKSISIFDSYGTTESLTEVSNISTDVIFFFGSFNKIDLSIQEFTNTEIDSLYNWSRRGGKLIITSVATIGAVYDARVLNLKWGYTWITSNPSSITPNIIGNSTDIFNGPFGNVTTANQSGSAQGYFSSIPLNSKVFSTDSNGNPTLFMDCNTLDLIIADVDSYTIYGEISEGDLISTNQDRFWANTIVFMDRLQPLPVIINNSGSLSLNSSYVGYQWFKDDSPISNESFLNTIDDGTYYVEVEFNGGCKINSDSIVILTVGTDKIEYDEKINLFPNPSKNFIQISGLSTKVYYKIYNILSQEVKNGFISNLEEIEITHFENGMYFLELNQSKTIKFLKE